jgi:6-pyruvoyl-tetrahydropterin synthase
MDAILVTERRRFAADHYHSLPYFCEPRHGHCWEIEATVAETDQGPLGAALDAWAKDVDHSLLNENETMAGRNPTAEVLAECLFRHLEASGLRPVVVRAKEKPHCWASCRLRRQT